MAMIFEQNDIAVDDDGAYHIFALLRPSSSDEATLGTIRYSYSEEPDAEAPWRGGRQMVKYVLEPKTDEMRLIGKALFDNIAIANVRGEAMQHLQNSLAGSRLKIILWNADIDVTDVAAQMPFMCTANVGVLAMYNPKVFEILKPHLQGNRFELNDELYTLLKLSL